MSDLDSWYVKGKRQRNNGEAVNENLYPVMDLMLYRDPKYMADPSVMLCDVSLEGYKQCLRVGTRKLNINHSAFAASRLTYNVDDIGTYYMLIGFDVDAHLFRESSFIFPDMVSARTVAEFGTKQGGVHFYLILPFLSTGGFLTPEVVIKMVKDALSIVPNNMGFTLTRENNIAFGRVIHKLTERYNGGFLSTNWTYGRYFPFPEMLAMRASEIGYEKGARMTASNRSQLFREAHQSVSNEDYFSYVVDTLFSPSLYQVPTNLGLDPSLVVTPMTSRSPFARPKM